MRLAMALTREELELLERILLQGGSFEDTPEMRDIHRRYFAAMEGEVDWESMPQKIAGELKMSPNP
jgi:hypothetical protein